MAYSKYWVYFRGKPHSPNMVDGKPVGPFLDIYDARRWANHLAAGYRSERHIYVVEITENGLLDVGFSGWNRKPFVNEVAA